MTDAPRTNSGGSGLTMVTLGVAVAALVIGLFAIMRSDDAGLQVPTDHDPMLRTFALSSDLVNGSNRYHPATLVAFAGDDIQFNVTNRGEGEHGFTVDGLGIADVIDEGETREYMASSVAPGVYPYYCQLHAGHIRGQLIVLDR
jgi:plastocyanin